MATPDPVGGEKKNQKGVNKTGRVGGGCTGCNPDHRSCLFLPFTFLRSLLLIVILSLFIPFAFPKDPTGYGKRIAWGQGSIQKAEAEQKGESHGREEK